LLGWAARYFPILRVLRRHVVDGQPILEVGSGSFGLAYFCRHPIVGCDVKFPLPPRRPMLPVVCSATKLPFPDRSFEAVIASDVLEHLPPTSREEAVREALRVTRKLAVFGFPSGPLAYTQDREFLEYHRRLRRVPPDWLVEHMQHPFPTADVFSDFRHDWLIESFGNESLRFHDWVNRREISPVWARVLALPAKLAPRLVERVLQTFDREPFYRKIFVLTAQVDAGAPGKCSKAN